MVQVIPKWRVEVVLAADEPQISFHVFDNHLANVLQVLARFDFGTVHCLRVERVQTELSQTGTFTSEPR